MNSYDQVTLEVTEPDVGYRQWAAGMDSTMDSIEGIYEVEDGAETE